MLLGLHTMGQGGRQFSEQELAFARRLAALLGQALERSEKALWDDEVARRSGAKEAEDSLAAAVAEAKAAAEPPVAAEPVAAEPPADEAAAPEAAAPEAAPAEAE